MGYQEGFEEPLNNLGNDQRPFRQIEEFAGDDLTHLTPDEILSMKEEGELDSDNDFNKDWKGGDEDPSNWEVEIEKGGKYYDDKGVKENSDDLLDDSLDMRYPQDESIKTKEDLLGITAKDRQHYEDRRMMGETHVSKPEKPDRDSIRFDEAI